MLRKPSTNFKRPAKIVTSLSPVDKLAQIYLNSPQLPSSTSLRKLPALISRQKAQSGTLNTAPRVNSGKKQRRSFREKFSECLNKLEELILKHPEIKDDLITIRGCVKECIRYENRQIQYLSRENYALSVKIEKLQNLLTQTSPVPKLNLDSKLTSNFHQEFMNRAEEFSDSWRNALRAGR